MSSTPSSGRSSGPARRLSRTCPGVWIPRSQRRLQPASPDSRVQSWDVLPRRYRRHPQHAMAGFMTKLRSPEVSNSPTRAESLSQLCATSKGCSRSTRPRRRRSVRGCRASRRPIRCGSTSFRIGQRPPAPDWCSVVPTAIGPSAPTSLLRAFPAAFGSRYVGPRRRLDPRARPSWRVCRISGIPCQGLETRRPCVDCCTRIPSPRGRCWISQRPFPPEFGGWNRGHAGSLAPPRKGACLMRFGCADPVARRLQMCGGGSATSGIATPPKPPRCAAGRWLRKLIPRPSLS